MKFSAEDERWMQQALTLAAKALGQTRPNPAVGAVVVKGGKAVGRGWHEAAGKPHAEVEALRKAGSRARGATLYVTLEPCSHQGRTPPCADAVIKAGVRRVVVAIRDPNPEVAGRGIRRLRRAGIEVNVGCCRHGATHLNQPFLTYHKLKRPFFVAKWALTLDGQYHAASGDAGWISNEESRRYVHELRARYDAVMAGIGTVLFDNPRLNARLPGKRNVIQPLRIILDGHLRMPMKAACLDMVDAGRTIIVTTNLAPPRQIHRFEERGVTMVVVEGKRGLVDMNALAGALHGLGVQSVLIEGGRKIHTAMLAADLTDRVVAFFAPKLVGSAGQSFVVNGWAKERMSEAVSLHDVEIRHFGTDVCVEGYLHHLGQTR